MPKDTAAKTATLYRMVMTDHMCPYGLKSKDLLERQGFHVEDRHLTSRDEVDAFKAKHDVKTTPQTFIGEERIGGFDDLSAHLGKATKSKDATTYKPVIALFAVALLMALAVTWVALGTVFTGRTVEWFISISMVLLGLQKLQDVERFATMFLNYDLLAQRWCATDMSIRSLRRGQGCLCWRVYSRGCRRQLRCS
jgi:glutaredoxin